MKLHFSLPGRSCYNHHLSSRDLKVTWSYGTNNIPITGDKWLDMGHQRWYRVVREYWQSAIGPCAFERHVTGLITTRVITLGFDLINLKSGASSWCGFLGSSYLPGWRIKSESFGIEKNWQGGKTSNPVKMATRLVNRASDTDAAWGGSQKMPRNSGIVCVSWQRYRYEQSRGNRGRTFYPASGSRICPGASGEAKRVITIISTPFY